MFKYIADSNASALSTVNDHITNSTDSRDSQPCYL